MQLKKLNDQVAFHTYPYFITSENIDEILKDYDFVVLCVDNFEALSSTMPAAGVIGNLQALEVIKYFTGMGTLLTGQMLTFDFLTMKSRIVKFPSINPECKACGK